MLYSKSLLVAACSLALAVLPARAEKKSGPSLNITQGPAKVQLGSVAQIDVPADHIFLDGDSYRAIMKEEGEPVSGQELGWLRNTNEHWSVVFEFSDDGYVKDDEKDKLNADKMLAAIKRGNDAANKQRVRAGNPPLEVVGWDMPPKYDATTHNLEWAIRGRCQGRDILNYNTRLLGRRGVMEVVLIVKPDQLSETLPTFRNLLTGYSFQAGQTYAEYRAGDKVAKYGLSALVVGGAAVGAAKLGLFTWLIVLLKKGGKVIILAFVAVAVFFKKIFSKIFGGRNQPGMGP